MNIFWGLFELGLIERILLFRCQAFDLYWDLRQDFYNTVQDIIVTNYFKNYNDVYLREIWDYAIVMIIVILTLLLQIMEVKYDILL